MEVAVRAVSPSHLPLLTASHTIQERTGEVKPLSPCTIIELYY